MKSISLLFLVALLFSTSCSYNQSHEIHSPSLSSRDTSILDTSNLQVNKIDTFDYLNLRYWDSTMDRFDSAYIDTFTVDGTKFRFINPVANKFQLDIVIYLEKLIKNKWVFTGFTVGTENYVGDYHHTSDVNGDGFVDITQGEKFVQAVYFYDPKTKTYPGTTDPHGRETNFINFEWELIDTTRKIFCDFQELKQMCGDIHSTLYTYDRFTKKDLFDLELYNCTKTNDDTHLITKLILSKCLLRKHYDPTIHASRDSLVEIQQILLSKPIDLNKDYDDNIGYFDYIKFWKEHYKNLLNYR